jgi:hypothetical protein
MVPRLVEARTVDAVTSLFINEIRTLIGRRNHRAGTILEVEKPSSKVGKVFHWWTRLGLWRRNGQLLATCAVASTPRP